MRPRFFATPAGCRAWLARNHGRAGELLVGFHKRESGRPSITWAESVDEALCFGWIDGVPPSGRSLGDQREERRDETEAARDADRLQRSGGASTAADPRKGQA